MRISQSINLLVLFFIFGCSPQEASNHIDIQASRQNIDFSKYANNWGIGSCQNPAANRTQCNKPALIINKNGGFEIRQYSLRTGRISKSLSGYLYQKDDGQVYLVPSSSKPENSSERISLISESDIDVLVYHLGKPNLGKRLKYVSIQDLKRGYQVLDPTGNPRVTKYSTSTGGGNLAIGSSPSRVSLSGQCGFPSTEVREDERRSWYNEASKQLSFGAFQNNTAARNEILSISKTKGTSSTCDAISKQVYAFLPSLNGSIDASNRLHNGSPIGLRCLSSSGASVRSACQATQIMYAIKTASFMCHEVCN